MPVTNWTGAQATATALRTDENHITGNCTTNAGATWTFQDAQTVRWDGNFNITSATSGILSAVGTATTRIIWQPNGASTTWSASVRLWYFDITSTGNWTMAYNDWIGGVFQARGSGTVSTTFCRIIEGYHGSQAFYITQSGGTLTIDDCEVHGTNSAGVEFSPSGGTINMRRFHVVGANLGGRWAPTGGTLTVSDWKIVNCLTPFTVGGTVAEGITNLAVINYGVVAVVSAVTASTITRLFAIGGREGGIQSTPAGGATVTLTECYVRSVADRSVNVGVNNAGAGTLAVSGSVVALPDGSLNLAVSGLSACASSGNDVIQTAANGAGRGILTGTSDNDFLAGNNGAWAGDAASGAEGPLQNWVNVTLNVDADSGNTASTSTPAQYGGPLAANRTNARATPNKPLTITSISSGTPTSEAATITFTTGIKARSRLLISTTSGNTTRAAAEMTTPWKYHGILDPEMVDFTLPVTSHSHGLVNLKAGTTYYYVVECYDPCGRRFLSTEQSFATTAAAGGGAARSGFAGAGMRVS